MGASLIFIVIALLVVFNTIQVGIYTHREEIGIMRLVGASNSFIRGPYIIEGIIYGLIAGLIGFLAFIPLIGVASPYVAKLIPEINLQNYFSLNFTSLLVYQFCFGVGLGILSSVFAVRRYLHI